MENNADACDTGPECPQSDNSYSLDAFGDIDTLIADLLEFVTMPPRTTEC